MNTALAYIAESVVKAVGVAGIEAMAMKSAIYAIWSPLAEELSDEVMETCFDYDNEEIREEYIDGIYQRYRTRMTEDFVEEAAPYVEEYVGYAWDRGREDAFGYSLSGLLTLQKDQESIITDLVTLTGSTKANVQRTIKRWFKETQGQYFDRFIVPETARLLSYEEGASLRSIGQNYKKFVKAEGYWSSVSEFNAESSKVFSQVQALHEMNVTSYTIQAVLDNKTCEVCQFMHGSTWSVEQAVAKVYDLLISEADEAANLNPFPPRSTTKDFEDPHDTPYNLPPYHPRCRCSVRSSSKVTAMPSQILARPFDAGPLPSNKILNKVYAQYVNTPSKANTQVLIDSGHIPSSARSLTRAERKVAQEAWESIPFEERKWAVRNKSNFELFIDEGADVTSRVEGDRIFMNAKYFDPEKYGPQPIQHELRHALVNPSVVDARGGGNTIWRELVMASEDAKKGWRSPVHVNAMYQLNGNQGLRAATAASDEFLAMIGDHYRPGMSMDELIKSVRHKTYGVDVSDKITSTLVSTKASRWSAREAKNACEYWWYAMDIDNNTLLSKKQMLSKLTHKPSTAQVRAVAIGNELDLRDTLRAAGIKDVYQEGDNAPFDVWVGADPQKWYSGSSKKKPWAIIEVKTIVRGKNDKITMHADSLARKKKELRKFGKKNTKAHTIVFDERTGKIYYRDDVGSFRLSAMEEVTLDDLQRKFGGTATGAIREQATIVEAPAHSVSGGAPAKARVTYKKQTTVAKAEAELKKKFGIEDVFFPESQWGDFTAKQKTLMLNQVGEELAYLNNDKGLYMRWATPYKKLKNGEWKYRTEVDFKKLTIYNDDNLDDLREIIGFRSAGASGLYDSRHKHLLLSVPEGDIFDSPHLIMGSADEWDAPYTIASGFTTGNLRHEIGHSIHFVLDEVEYPKINYWRKWQEIYASEKPDWWVRNVSRYASTDSMEAFAESFSAYMHPEYGVDLRLPKKIEDFFSDILGSQKTIRHSPEYLDALAEAEANRKKIKGVSTVSLSKLKDMRPLEEGGINVSYTAKMTLPPKVKGGKRRVKKVLYKPIQGESWIASDLPSSELGLPSGWTFQGDVPESLWSEFQDRVGVPPDAMIRRNITNLNVPLAYREMAAIDVANELKLKNVKFAKSHVVTENGKPVGVAIEWKNGMIEELEYYTAYASSYKPLTLEEKFEYTIFDYLIGNTDRHNRNIMRNKRTGKTLAIDHGYSFPSRNGLMEFGMDAEYSDFSLDGLDEWKCIPSRNLGREVDFDYDPDDYYKILDRLENLDVQGIASRYGFDRGETYAFEYRRRVLMRLMVDNQVGEYFHQYHLTGLGQFPVPEEFGLENLNVELWENVTEANIP